MYGLVYKFPPPFLLFKGKKRHFIPHLSKSICTACILSAGQHSLFFVGGGIRLLFFSPLPSFFHFRDILNFLISLRLLSRAYFLIFISEAKTLSLLSTHPQSKIHFLPFLVLFIYFGKNLQRSSGFIAGDTISESVSVYSLCLPRVHIILKRVRRFPRR